VETSVIFWPTIARSEPITDAGFDGVIIGDDADVKSRGGVMGLGDPPGAVGGF
jgi:hypothetical protein